MVIRCLKARAHQHGVGFQCLSGCLISRIGIQAQAGLLVLAQQEIIVVDDSGAQIVFAEVGSLNILEDHQGNFIALVLVDSIGVKVQQAVVAFLLEA